jgi:ABC-2 type transport system permease protein
MRAFLALVRKEVLYLRAYPLDLLNLAVSPGLLVAPYLVVAKLFGAGPDLQSSVAVGLLLWYWLSTLFWTVGYGIREEMEEGVLESLLTTPTSLLAVLGAKAVAGMVENAYITLGIVGWLFAFGIALPLPWPAFVGVMFLTGLGLGGFCMAYAGVVLLVKRAENTGEGMQMALGMLAGMTLPPQLFPRSVWIISRVIPLSYGIEAARRLLSGDVVEREIAWLVASGAAYAFAGWALLRRAERRMKAAGTTGEF